MPGANRKQQTRNVVDLLVKLATVESRTAFTPLVDALYDAQEFLTKACHDGDEALFRTLLILPGFLQTLSTSTCKALQLIEYSSGASGSYVESLSDALQPLRICLTAWNGYRSVDLATKLEELTAVFTATGDYVAAEVFHMLCDNWSNSNDCKHYSLWAAL